MDEDDRGYESEGDTLQIEDDLREVIEAKRMIITNRLIEEADASLRKKYMEAIEGCDDYLANIICLECFLYDFYQLHLLDIFDGQKEMFPKRVWFYFDGSLDLTARSFLKCTADRK